MCSQPPNTEPTLRYLRVLRVFLSSPGDVADERALARRLLKDELSYERPFRDRVTFEVVSWDDPAAPTPMLATLPPQEVVNRGLPKPSECDVVVVILWSRMGTPLPADQYQKPSGKPYLSGTEWELEDARNAERKPDILIYQRSEVPRVAIDDPKPKEKLQQYRLVKKFINKQCKTPTGALRGGVNTYVTPTEFKGLLAKHLRDLVWRRISEFPKLPTPANTVLSSWKGPPYPGLRAFMSEEAAIFFGRGRETDALIARLRDPDQRFLAVVGASGMGKSSLVRAGLLPRLAAGAIEGSQDWRVLTLTPGAIGDNNPFSALAVEVNYQLPVHARKTPGEIARELAKAPQCMAKYAAALLADQPPSAELILFVDQFEELFTLITEQYRAPFADLLGRVCKAVAG